MADVVPPEVRSRMMAGIRSRDTQPEIILRRGLHKEGFRFKLHDRLLPGCPDLVLPKWRAVLFAHGCFWHGHDCHLFKWPSSREEFWRKKIERNRIVDGHNEQQLLSLGWRVGVIWECALKGRNRCVIDEVIDEISLWLKSDQKSFEVRGKLDAPQRSFV